MLKFLKVSWLFCMGLSLLTNLFLLSKMENWQLLKDEIKMADVKLSGGYLRRLFKKEEAPNIQKTDLLFQGDYSWLPQSTFFSIAHGLGPGYFTGGNTIPTFNQGLKLGFKIFEVDLVYTKDNSLICYHGENDQQIANLSLEDWKKILAHHNMSECYFTDLIRLAKENPQIYFVLDVKNRFDEVYGKIIEMLKLEEARVAKQFIPQIYFFNQLKLTRNANLFSGEIYTSYVSALSTEAMVEWCRKLGIQALTLTTQRLNEIETIPVDLTVLTHPVDDTNEAVKYKRRGVDGIYTYYLTHLYIAT